MSGSTDSNFRSMERLSSDFPEIHEMLLLVKQRLEQSYRTPKKWEFVIENGALYLVQTMDADLTTEATIRVRKDMFEKDDIAMSAREVDAVAYQRRLAKSGRVQRARRREGKKNAARRGSVAGSRRRRGRFFRGAGAAGQG